jgi:oligogalacturonide transport system permease protein
LFVLPFVLGVLLFKLFPFVMSLALSFTQYDLIDPPQYVGLENYRELALADPLFSQSLWASRCCLRPGSSAARGLCAVHCPCAELPSLRGINFFRAAFYLPSILGGSIAVAVLWRFIFAKNGLVNLVLAGRSGTHSLAGRRALPCGPSCCCSPGSLARPW